MTVVGQLISPIPAACVLLMAASCASAGVITPKVAKVSSENPVPGRHASHTVDGSGLNSSGEHLLNLINDVLEMSKIEAGQQELNPVSFDLFHLLDEVSNMMQVRTTAKGISLETAIEERVPQFIWADESKMRQILINLIGNSAKFTKRVALWFGLISIAMPANCYLK